MNMRLARVLSLKIILAHNYEISESRVYRPNYANLPYNTFITGVIVKKVFKIIYKCFFFLIYLLYQ